MHKHQSGPVSQRAVALLNLVLALPPSVIRFDSMRPRHDESLQSIINYQLLLGFGEHRRDQGPARCLPVCQLLQRKLA